jgi:hypothetical protein
MSVFHGDGDGDLDAAGRVTGGVVEQVAQQAVQFGAVAAYLTGRVDAECVARAAGVGVAVFGEQVVSQPGGVDRFGAAGLVAGAGQVEQVFGEGLQAADGGQGLAGRGRPVGVFGVGLALIFLLPPARALARADNRTAAMALLSATLFGCWFGAFMLTTWHYGI